MSPEPSPVVLDVDVDGVLLDNDGVLVDSHAVVDVAWRRLSQEFGLDVDRVLGELAGVRAADTLGRHLSGERLARAVVRLEDLEVELAAQVGAVAGAAELLRALPRERWTVVTSATTRLAEARWRGARLPVPERPVTADDVGRGKPDPEPYLRGAAALGLDPVRCVVLEDSASGAAAATAAGCRVVAVGNQPWDVEPAARVDDLTSLRVEVRRDGSGAALRLHVG